MFSLLIVDYRRAGTLSWNMLATVPSNIRSFEGDFSKQSGGSYELLILPDNVDTGGFKAGTAS
jgi:hypothetical protein